MSVLITGAGLVGSQIARLEQEAGRTPVLFDVAPRLDALADFVDLDKAVIVRGDITNPLDLVAAITANGVRRIVHTAAFGGLAVGSKAAPLTSTAVNVMGTAYVLETARVLGLDRVVLASSSGVYTGMRGGEDDGQYGFEEAHPRPGDVYAANKQAAEDLGRAYRASFGLDVVAVRYAAVFGPWGPGGGGIATTAVERWLRSALAGEPAEINFSGLDWVYSKDAAKGTFRACWAEGPLSPLYNLGMGRPSGAEEIADVINAMEPGDCAKVSPSPVTAVRPAMSIERARRELGFEVEFPIDLALRDYRDWIAARPR
jgi:nucleoside-diphosphate-sugar epimerase